MKKYIAFYHCNYHTGAPSSCGYVLGVYDSVDKAEKVIANCIYEDIQREIDRARECNRDPHYEKHFFPNDEDWDRRDLDAECCAYSDIDNEEVFYYIDEEDI